MTLMEESQRHCYSLMSTDFTETKTIVPPHASEYLFNIMHRVQVRGWIIKLIQSWRRLPLVVETRALKDIDDGRFCSIQWNSAGCTEQLLHSSTHTAIFFFSLLLFFFWSRSGCSSPRQLESRDQQGWPGSIHTWLREVTASFILTLLFLFDGPEEGLTWQPEFVLVLSCCHWKEGVKKRPSVLVILLVLNVSDVEIVFSFFF